MAVPTLISQLNQTANLNSPGGGEAPFPDADDFTRALSAFAAILRDSGHQWVTSISGTDTITGSVAAGLAAYVAGQKFSFVTAGANTGTAPTVNFNALGAKSITRPDGSSVAIGEIKSGQVVHLVYTGSAMQLMSSTRATTADTATTATSATTATTATSATTATTANGVAAGSVGTAGLANGAATAQKIAGGTGSGNLTQYTAGNSSLPAAGTSYSDTHSLGVVPSHVALEVTCTTTDIGYSVGDVVQVIAVWNGTSNGPANFWKSTTSVGLAIPTGYAVVLPDKSTGVFSGLTVGKWSWRFRIQAA